MNWNPFSSRGRLDELTFFLTIILLILFVTAATFFIKIPLHEARVNLNLNVALRYYGLWFFISVCCFWMVTSAFIKRWKAILDLDEMPKILRTLMRFLLLSPLLSVWMLAFTCFFTRWGPLEEKISRLKLVRVAGLSFVIFHLGFLGWSVMHGDLLLDHAGLHLAGEHSARESLARLLPKGGEHLPPIPDEKFAIHVFPYMSPSLKIGTTVYGDFQRVRILYNAVTEHPENFCQTRLGYLGVQVDDCFFFQYRKMAESSPFVSPMLAILFEGRYRQRGNGATGLGAAAAVGEDPVAPVHAPGAETDTRNGPLGQIASSLLVFNNILTAIEPSSMLRERAQLISPRGFLPYFGSPELVMMEFGQDAQRFEISHQVLPLLRPQLKQIAASMTSVAEALPEGKVVDVSNEIQDLNARMNVLQTDPLFLHYKNQSAAAGM